MRKLLITAMLVIGVLFTGDIPPFHHVPVQAAEDVFADWPEGMRRFNPSYTQLADIISTQNNLPRVKVFVEKPVKPWPYAYYRFEAPDKIVFSTQMVYQIEHTHELMYLIALKMANVFELTRDNAIAEELLTNYTEPFFPAWLTEEMYQAVIALDYVENITVANFRIYKSSFAMGIIEKLHNDYETQITFARLLFMKHYFKVTHRNRVFYDVEKENHGRDT